LNQTMKNVRKYGKSPYTVAVVHGGPGVPGEVASVARELAADYGILEPLQTKASLTGQIKELQEVLKRNGDLPVVLAGYSWGAWLSFLVAAYYPEIVKKLILISSGSFQEKYVSGMQQIRMNRLKKDERTEVETLIDMLNDPATKDKNAAFKRFGELFSKADAFDPVSQDPEIVECRFDIFQAVWQEAEQIRRNGTLLELGEKIACPVTAIHGDYDSHPAQGVREPLSSVLEDFHFILLEKCGHKPWIERHAREEFFRVLKEELKVKD